MAQLRWILLVFGVAFCLGLWWWETRRRGRSRTPEPLREFDVDVPSFPAARASELEYGRIEPTFDNLPAAFESDLSDLARSDPALEALEPVSDFEEDTVNDPEPTPPANKIISMRLTCVHERPFGGRELREALQAAGMTHGKFSIFHRQSDEGMILFSVASLTEPGSFDLQTMDQQQFRGVTFFALLQDAGEEGVDEMRDTAHQIAAKLRGNLSGGN